MTVACMVMSFVAVVTGWMIVHELLFQRYAAPASARILLIDEFGSLRQP
ncbi:MAG: hypothetical protein V4672_16895 [Verrucomicrobiota bacterium]